MTPHRLRPTYSGVVATLALAVALGTGGAYAAAKIDGRTIKAGTVRTAQLAKNAVTSPKVKNGSLRAVDFKAGQLPAGAPGPAGAEGQRDPLDPKDPRSLPGPAGPVGPVGPSTAYSDVGDDIDEEDGTEHATCTVSVPAGELRRDRHAGAEQQRPEQAHHDQLPAVQRQPGGVGGGRRPPGQGPRTIPPTRTGRSR